MDTVHGVTVGDARWLPLTAGGVDLVVTSPPYPMFEMWDATYAAQDPAIGDALADGDGDRAFELMPTCWPTPGPSATGFSVMAASSW